MGECSASTVFFILSFIDSSLPSRFLFSVHLFSLIHIVCHYLFVSVIVSRHHAHSAAVGLERVGDHIAGQLVD